MLRIYVFLSHSSSACCTLVTKLVIVVVDSLSLLSRIGILINVVALMFGRLVVDWSMFRLWILISLLFGTFYSCREINECLVDWSMSRYIDQCCGTLINVWYIDQCYGKLINVSGIILIWLLFGMMYSCREIGQCCGWLMNVRYIDLCSGTLTNGW